jgi:hypothetical protein
MKDNCPYLSFFFSTTDFLFHFLTSNQITYSRQDESRYPLQTIHQTGY